MAKPMKKHLGCYGDKGTRSLGVKHNDGEISMRGGGERI